MGNSDTPDTEQDDGLIELGDGQMEDVQGGITLDNGIKRTVRFVADGVNNDTLFAGSTPDTVDGPGGVFKRKR